MRCRSKHCAVAMFDDIQVFTTCPQSKDHPRDYLEQVTKVSKWSDQAGCTGILIYSDNSIIDPWAVAQIVIQQTVSLAPLVAVQPVYMHPYWVAKKVASFGFLYRRPIWLNMIAGGFRGDLMALGDTTEHDARYARLIEYCQIIQRLLIGEKVTYEGAFYRVQGLAMAPMLPYLKPNIMMSGSSEASLRAAKTLDAIAVEYPEPIASLRAVENRGIRVGIIAHENHADAWRIAHERFPPDRRGQLQHAMAIRVSDSTWQQRLGSLPSTNGEQPYWLWPFKNYQTFCPYFVGDYQTVANEIARFIASGYRTFILDIPRDNNDLVAAQEVFRRARGAV